MLLAHPGERAPSAAPSKPSTFSTSQKLGPPRRCRPRSLKVSSLHINHRAHLELAWQREKAEVALLRAEKTSCPVDCVREIRSLNHLEHVVASAGSSVVVLFCYSRSCGICKEVLQHCAQLCKEGSRQREGVLFLKHNIRDEFDDVSDVARWYRIKHVPCFAFFVGGAQMRRMSVPDSRQHPHAIQRLWGWQRGQVQSTLREMVFRAAPSARR